MEYFSEREGRLAPRNSEMLTDEVVRGIGALIRSLVSADAFAQSFPVRCSRCSRQRIAQFAEQDFWDALGAIAPSLEGWPKAKSLGFLSKDALARFQVLDAIEFCYAHIAEAHEVEVAKRSTPFVLHVPTVASLFSGEPREHYHLQVDQETGQNEFREQVEDIFRRNGIAYTLTESGHVERILPSELGESIRNSEFNTGDHDLDDLLTTAQSKFLDPNPKVRQEALESLWDAWERLKTIWPGFNKKEQAKAMLAETAGPDSPLLGNALDREAKELTNLGNSLQIRHFERGKEKLGASEHVDYLFQRMFSLIWMILRTQKMVGADT